MAAVIGINRDQRLRTDTHCKVNGILQSTVTVAKQNADLGVSEIGYSYIALAVSVEVCDHERRRRRTNCIRHLWFEGSIPIADQHADLVVGAIGDSQIQHIVAVKVAQS